MQLALRPWPGTILNKSKHPEALRSPTALDLTLTFCVFSYNPSSHFHLSFQLKTVKMKSSLCYSLDMQGTPNSQGPAMCHFSFWPFRRKEGGQCAIVYPGDVREIRAFAEQNAWQFYLILACTRVFTLRQHDQSYLCSNLLWELQQHSQKLEKKTTLITQTCHLSYDLDDMPLKAGLPECHRQS